MSDKLRECPNCKTVPDKIENVRLRQDGIVVDCPSCHMRGPAMMTEGRAIAAWNALPRAPQWVTYTGEAKTLPVEGTEILICDKYGHNPNRAHQASRQGVECPRYVVDTVLARAWKVGDRWMPWPKGEE